MTKHDLRALRGLVDAAMVIVGNALDFNETRQIWFCTVCRYRDPLGDKGTRLHADECPIYKLHAAADVAAPLIEPAIWVLESATLPTAEILSDGEGKAIGSANDPSVLRSSVREGVAQDVKDEESCAPANGIQSGSDRISASAGEKAPSVSPLEDLLAAYLAAEDDDSRASDWFWCDQIEDRIGRERYGQIMFDARRKRKGHRSK
jgi:hypothetical protein